MTTPQTHGTLDQLGHGQRRRIARIQGERTLRRCLLDMGMVASEEVVVTAVAPLGDPIALTIKGSRLSLRKDEARHILLEAFDATAV